MNIKYARQKHAILAVDNVIFTIKDSELQVLLIKTTKIEYKDHWALPGGLVGADESIEDAVIRHLKSKTGLANIHTEQLATFGNPKRDPFGRVVSVAYIALVPSDNQDLKTTKEYSDIKWFEVKNLPKLAYDHLEITLTALNRLQAKIEYTNITKDLLPTYFTLTDLQNVYEIILDKEVDKRNFRKKILSLGIISETKKLKEGEAHRPAKLYKFRSKAPQIVEIL